MDSVEEQAAPLNGIPSRPWWTRARKHARTVREKDELIEMMADEIHFLRDQVREHGGIPRRKYDPRKLYPTQPLPIGDVEMNPCPSSDDSQALLLDFASLAPPLLPQTDPVS